MTLEDDIRRAAKTGLFIYIIDQQDQDAQPIKWTRAEDGWRGHCVHGVEGPFRSLCDVWYYCGGDVRPERVKIRYKHRFLSPSEIVMFDNPLARREYDDPKSS